jgi:hypothetical protein
MSLEAVFVGLLSNLLLLHSTRMCHNGANHTASVPRHDKHGEVAHHFERKMVNNFSVNYI